MKIDLSTTIAGTKLPFCVCNASGPKDSTLSELKDIGQSDSGAIVIKSCTIEPRAGNEEPRYAELPFGSIQSMGLPNLGYKKYLDYLKTLKRYNKPIIASIAGLCEKDYLVMVKAFQASEVDLIEINFSCPNIKGKPQIGYDFGASKAILKKISRIGGKPIGLKLPPYFDLVHQQKMAKIILDHNVSFITCINSVGNTLAIDPEKETTIIRSKEGLGGLCGDYIKPIALANVKIFYKLLKNRVSIFGVGGISTGTDVFEFVLAGANGVQIATTFEREGVRSFSRIKNELTKLLANKKYRGIKTPKGKLRVL